MEKWREKKTEGKKAEKDTNGDEDWCFGSEAWFMFFSKSGARGFYTPTPGLCFSYKWAHKGVRFDAAGQGPRQGRNTNATRVFFIKMLDVDRRGVLTLRASGRTGQAFLQYG